MISGRPDPFNSPWASAKALPQDQLGNFMIDLTALLFCKLHFLMIIQVCQFITWRIITLAKLSHMVPDIGHGKSGIWFILLAHLGGEHDSITCHQTVLMSQCLKWGKFFTVEDILTGLI